LYQRKNAAWQDAVDGHSAGLLLAKDLTYHIFGEIDVVDPRQTYQSSLASLMRGKICPPNCSVIPNRTIEMVRSVNYMATTFFDRTPANWKELEDLVQQAFVEMGYESNRAYKLKTVRGTVEIDVHAIQISTPIPMIVLCECKHWNKPVTQNVIHGFRTVCQDAGAHFGLIISNRGFQSGAENSRIATNVHLMNFQEFQGTFFSEWKQGVFMMLVKMRDQLLPISRASVGMQENGLDLIDKVKLEGVDALKKYSIFFGYDGGYSKFFIYDAPFPATINDPRGNPKRIVRTKVFSHREYIEIAREAVVEATRHFDLPSTYFSHMGTMLDPTNSGGKVTS
jgi:hypothetical protein